MDVTRFAEPVDPATLGEDVEAVATQAAVRTAVELTMDYRGPGWRVIHTWRERNHPGDLRLALWNVFVAARRGLPREAMTRDADGRRQVRRTFADAVGDVEIEQSLTTVGDVPDAVLAAVLAGLSVPSVPGTLAEAKAAYEAAAPGCVVTVSAERSDTAEWLVPSRPAPRLRGLISRWPMRRHELAEHVAVIERAVPNVPPLLVIRPVVKLDRSTGELIALVAERFGRPLLASGVPLVRYLTASATRDVAPVHERVRWMTPAMSLDPARAAQAFARRFASPIDADPDLPLGATVQQGGGYMRMSTHDAGASFKLNAPKSVLTLELTGPEAAVRERIRALVAGPRLDLAKEPSLQTLATEVPEYLRAQGFETAGLTSRWL